MSSVIPDSLHSESSSDLQVAFESSVLQGIRSHARSSMAAEICGVLIGKAVNGGTVVTACIAGENASQGGAHVTFTQDTWSHIYKEKDSKFPDQSIVGWYHSHPGFGVFLSDHDLFIHKNFFNAPHQIAWVFDPHSDEEGCFGWVDGKVHPLTAITVTRQQRKPTGGKEELPYDLTKIGKGNTAEELKGRLLKGKSLGMVIVTLLILGAFAASYFWFHRAMFKPEWLHPFTKDNPTTMQPIESAPLPAQIPTRQEDVKADSIKPLPVETAEPPQATK